MVDDQTARMCRLIRIIFVSMQRNQVSHDKCKYHMDRELVAACFLEARPLTDEEPKQARSDPGFLGREFRWFRCIM